MNLRILYFFLKTTRCFWFFFTIITASIVLSVVVYFTLVKIYYIIYLYLYIPPFFPCNVPQTSKVFHIKKEDVIWLQMRQLSKWDKMRHNAIIGPVQVSTMTKSHTAKSSIPETNNVKQTTTLISIMFIFINCHNNNNGTIFSAPDAHFDNTCLFSDARGQNMWNPKLILKMKSYNPKVPKSIAKSVKWIRALHEGDTFLNFT